MTNEVSDFISVPSPSTKNNLHILIDTEAEISILKLSSINNLQIINRSDTIFMRGITTEKQQSLGSIKIPIIFHHLSIEHTFHIVSNDFPLTCNGILGKDFMKKHGCCIDYKKRTFTVQPEKFPSATIDIINANYDNFRNTIQIRNFSIIQNSK